MYIPPEIADEVSDFPYMDKEIQGASSSATEKDTRDKTT